MHRRHSFLKKIPVLGFAGLLLTGSAARADLETDLPQAKKLYLTKCSKCHKLYDPKEYDDLSWDEWTGKMKKKAKLSDEQYRLIRLYMESLRKK